MHYYHMSLLMIKLVDMFVGPIYLFIYLNLEIEVIEDGCLVMVKCCAHTKST